MFVEENGFFGAGCCGWALPNPSRFTSAFWPLFMAKGLTLEGDVEFEPLNKAVFGPDGLDCCFEIEAKGSNIALKVKLKRE